MQQDNIHEGDGHSHHFWGQADIVSIVFAKADNQAFLKGRLVCKDMKRILESSPEISLTLSELGASNACSTFFTQFRGKLSVECLHYLNPQSSWLQALLESVALGLHVEKVKLDVSALNLSALVSCLETAAQLPSRQIAALRESKETMEKLMVTTNKIVQTTNSIEIGIEAHVSAYEAKRLKIRGLKVENTPYVGNILSLVPSLTSLDLCANELASAGAAALFDNMRQLTSLRFLNLSHNRLGVVGGNALADSISCLSSLTSLNLCSNLFGEDGGTAIARRLSQLISLQFLDFANNDVGSRGGKAIVEGLAPLSMLQRLDLRYNHLNPEGGEAIACGLGQLTSLESLDLDWNDLGPRGGHRMAECLCNIPSLKDVTLRSNNLGDEAAEAIAHRLAEHTRLESLDLAYNRVTDEAKGRLAARLSRIARLRLD